MKMDIKNKADVLLKSIDADTLGRANLQGADLQGANLRYADLQGANLKGANLRYADLQGANLRYADLQGANLRYADLRYADLKGANLQDSNLRRTNLQGANLEGADLKNADLPFFQIPGGELIVWGRKDGRLVKLRIPEESKRTACLINHKCRAEYVFVEWIEGDDPVTVKNEWGEITYTVGESVYPHDYCDDIRLDCAPGIHFFCDRREAEAWS